jgi:Glycosyl hydrolase family 63 N-terminal domain/Glycosyl hydrolase family 63 C-terminal domain
VSRLIRMIVQSASIMGLLAICLYCATLFTSHKSGSIAAFVANSAACQKATSWSSGHRFNISSPMALPLWGSYRPGIYFGMKTRTPMALSTGILWSGSRKNNLRHDTNQDELTQFEWVKHDGINYGNQNLIDKSYDMAISTTFLVKEVISSETLNSEDSGTAYCDGIKKIEESSWVQRISVKSIEKSSIHRSSQKSLYFYIGYEGADQDEFQKLNFISDLDIIGIPEVPILSNNFSPEDTSVENTSALLQTVTIVGKSELSGYFRLLLSLKEEKKNTESEPGTDSESGSVLGTARADRKDFEISYHGLYGGDVSSGVEYLKQSFSTAQYMRDNEEHSMFLRNGRLKNKMEENSNFLVIQVRSDIDFVLDTVFFENIRVTNSDDLSILATKEMEIYNTKNEIKGISRDDNSGRKIVQNSAVMKDYYTENGDIVDSEKIDKWIEHYENEFEKKFAKLYNLSSKMNEENKLEFLASNIETAKRTLSSLLGGIGYFYGSPR